VLCATCYGLRVTLKRLDGGKIVGRGMWAVGCV
jgi:hypothetical protein